MIILFVLAVVVLGIVITAEFIIFCGKKRMENE